MILMVRMIKHAHNCHIVTKVYAPVGHGGNLIYFQFVYYFIEYTYKQLPYPNSLIRIPEY